MNIAIEKRVVLIALARYRTHRYYYYCYYYYYYRYYYFIAVIKGQSTGG